MNILLTGCAGFIGSHTLERLLSDGHTVLGVDNFDPFYSRVAKNQNLKEALNYVTYGKVIDPASFELIEADLAESATYPKIEFLAGSKPIDAIIHLAAKAGVRPSIEDPQGYQRANVIATQNLLEFAKKHSIRQFIFASSSSVYGVNQDVPWKEEDAVLKPISPYASTKVSCELMGHVYSELFNIRVLGLRFFTVYGPRQRPDLAINKFIRLISEGKPIPVFGGGSTRRDYTYIDDIVEGVIGALHYDRTNYELFNLGNDQTVTLSQMIEIIESLIGKKAIVDRQPEQLGDVPQTWADITKSKALLKYSPKVILELGIKAQIEYSSK